MKEICCNSIYVHTSILLRLHDDCSISRSFRPPILRCLPLARMGIGDRWCCWWWCKSVFRIILGLPLTELLEPRRGVRLIDGFLTTGIPMIPQSPSIIIFVESNIPLEWLCWFVWWLLRIFLSNVLLCGPIGGNCWLLCCWLLCCCGGDGWWCGDCWWGTVGGIISFWIDERVSQQLLFVRSLCWRWVAAKDVSSITVRF